MKRNAAALVAATAAADDDDDEQVLLLTASLAEMRYRQAHQETSGFRIAIIFDHTHGLRFDSLADQQAVTVCRRHQLQQQRVVRKEERELSV